MALRYLMSSLQTAAMKTLFCHFHIIMAVLTYFRNQRLS